MRHEIVLVAGIALVSFACRQTDSGSSSTGGKGTTAAAQIEHGGRVFGANCAKCHGSAGQGGDGPQLVGAGALPLDPRPDQKVRKNRFHTAADVAKFVTTSMPPSADARKKLSESDYWAVLAFALSANGVKLKESVGPHNAASIVLHP